MPNALTRHVSLSAGSWFLETLVKHYFDQLFRERKGRDDAEMSTEPSGELRRDELLYDEVFHIVKSFMDASIHHTVEELQQFSNTRTPSAPWMHVMRVRVPMSLCDDAAGYLVDVLGGEEKTRQLVGGSKWWQVRGIKGVDAQWIVARKDYQRLKKHRKQQKQAERDRREASENSEEEAVYDPEMDELRCILYFHGGGYYFGSVDQERYFIQRFARKSGCRLLAISYRLAPQYPFPCAIQDALASYLYLIRPPPDAPHTPVNPAHIIFSGDSAGGGLTLALLQVLRDSNLPLPAGAIPISPWCDLTHSFPSIHINTDTDVIPKYGLSIYKPSPLWPPPPDDLTDRVQAGLRSRIKQVARQYRKESDGRITNEEPVRASSFWRRKFSFGKREKRNGRSVSRGRSMSRTSSVETLADNARTGDVRAAAVRGSLSNQRVGQNEKDLNLGRTAPLPTADQTNVQTLTVETESGEKLEVHDQVHMYAPNTLLTHPLVSPALSYLGGLPPLLIIAGDGEVLRDEIIYTAHKAAHPERYPIKPEARKMYPKLEGIEERFGPTKVHLQVYDHAAHTLPVLFFVCRPAKFCFRAMATFSKYVLGTLPIPPSASNSSSSASPPRKQSFRRSLSLSVPRRLSVMGSRRRLSYSQRPVDRQPANGQVLESAVQVGSPGRASLASSRSSTSERLDPDTSVQEKGVRLAGNPIVYQQATHILSSPFIDNMIRERVSIRGELRPLEPESDLPACNMPLDRIGVAGELALRRYLEGSTKWNERFARTKEHIRKMRARSLTLAKSDTIRNVTQLQMYFFQNSVEDGDAANAGGSKGIKEGLRRSAASWAWAWALDGAERPPPSSIVARRDTEEARRLSRIADMPADTHDHRVSGNNLWSYLVNKLSLEKNEARVEQRAVDEDTSGVGEELSVDSAGQAESTSTRNINTSQGRSRKPRWPRSLSRAATGTKSVQGRGKIRRFVSASAVRAEPQALQDDRPANEAEMGDLSRVRSN